MSSVVEARSPFPMPGSRPAPSPPREYRFPTFERRALPNGLGLIVAPVRKLPVVTVRAVVEAGAMAEPAGREGVAQLTARALLEGTSRLDASAFAERLERLGASAEAGATWDVSALGMTVLADRLPEAFALFTEVLRAPSFPERQVLRLRAERLAELLNQRAEPRGLADEMFERVLYAPGSRYATPEHGSEASVGTLGRAEAEAFYRARYRPGGTTLVVVGDLGADDAAALAERLRDRVESDFNRGGRQLVTASFGIATLPEHAGDGESLLSEADRALYSAKNSGRNRVHRAGQLVG
jgi:predicted Zn-dependent peptidase